MGWKNIKEHYRIDHHVQVTSEGICIGSPYIHDIIVISKDGVLSKEYDRDVNDKLARYQADMKADPEKLREMVLAEDTFETSIPVYTYRGSEVIEKQCEQPGWPNVTHDGDMMYENTFFADRDEAIIAAKNNCEAGILLRRMELSDLKQRTDKSKAKLQELTDNAKALGLPTQPEQPSEAERQSLALAASSQAAAALAELIRFAKEGSDHDGTFGQVEVVELLIDATKMAIECLTEEDDAQRYSSIYGDLCHEIRFWA